MICGVNRMQGGLTAKKPVSLSRKKEQFPKIFILYLEFQKVSLGDTFAPNSESLYLNVLLRSREEKRPDEEALEQFVVFRHSPYRQRCVVS
jgi:hypothetical protein